MAEALTQIVNLLTNFGTETAKISALTEQAAQCRDILKYIDELKKEAGHAVNQLAQMLVTFQFMVALIFSCWYNFVSLCFSNITNRT